MLHLRAERFEIDARPKERPSVVMFYAAWCPNCAMMKPVIEEIEKRYSKKILFCEAEIEECASAARAYGVETVPTFFLLKGGEIEGVMRGTVGEKVLEKRIRELI